MLDLIIRNARHPADSRMVDFGIKDGRIVEVRPKLPGSAIRELDAEGYLVVPPFVDCHFHLDTALTSSAAGENLSGTLEEGFGIWRKFSEYQSYADIKSRALQFCMWSIARGVLAIRSHVDVSDDAQVGLAALLDLRDELRTWLDIQLVAFPMQGVVRSRFGIDNLKRAISKGADVVGGIPHIEGGREEGRLAVRQLFEIAAKHDLMVDMHCDENDDPQSRYVEDMIHETHRLGLQGRVVGSHLTSMHSMDTEIATEIISTMVDAEFHVTANPLANITLQGRGDSYPIRRGMTRVKELAAAGVNVAMGHDSNMDPWFSMGSHDMLEVASMGFQIGHLTGKAGKRLAFDAVTANAAQNLGLKGYGLEIGCNADLVVLQCRDLEDALRLHPARLFVVRGGECISQTPIAYPAVNLGGHNKTVTFTL